MILLLVVLNVEDLFLVNKLVVVGEFIFEEIYKVYEKNYI